MYSLANVAEHPFLGPEAVYVLDLQRTAAGLVAISSDQHLSLFGPGRIENGPISSWRTQHGNLTTLSLFDAQESVVCTAGEDGTVGVWDLRQSARVAQFHGGIWPFLFPFVPF